MDHIAAPTDTPQDAGVVLDLTATVSIKAPAEKAYALFSDVTRMGEWSPECVGGEWISGKPGQIGALFLGHNRRGDQSWTTECEVTTAAPPHRFTFDVVRAVTAGVDLGRGVLVWAFEVRDQQNGCQVTQTMLLRDNPAMRAQFAALTEQQRQAEFDVFRTRIQHGMNTTLHRIKATAEL